MGVLAVAAARAVALLGMVALLIALAAVPVLAATDALLLELGAEGLTGLPGCRNLRGKVIVQLFRAVAWLLWQILGGRRKLAVEAKIVGDAFDIEVEQLARRRRHG